MDTLYSQKILQTAAEITHIGTLTQEGKQADAKAEAVSRLCGSRVSVEICFDAASNSITDFAQQVSACALGQVACALVAQNIIGCTANEFHKVAEQMRAMLHSAAAPPRGAKWQELKVLAEVHNYPNRHASTLLIFDAIEDCLTQLGA